MKIIIGLTRGARSVAAFFVMVLLFGINLVHAQSTNFTVSISNPANGQTFAAPANIVLNASVTDSNPVTAVEFFSNGGLVGALTNSPFALTWSNVPAGSYPATRHSRGYNLSFADGHVERYNLYSANTVSPATSVSPTNSDWVKLKQISTIPFGP